MTKSWQQWFFWDVTTEAIPSEQQNIFDAVFKLI